MKKNLFFYIPFFLVSICVITFTAFLSQNAIICVDNFGLTEWGSKYSDIILFRAFDKYMGGYLTNILSLFMHCTLPLALGIHPADFICTPIGIIQGIIIIFLTTFLIKYSLFHKKNHLYKFSIFLFSITYFFYFIFRYDSWVLTNNQNFYRYPVSILLFITFWYFIFKNIHNKHSKPKGIHIILLSILGFLLGTNMEITIFTSALLLILIITYNFYTKNEKFILGKSFYIPCASLFLGLLIYLFSNAFNNISQERGLKEISISLQTLSEFFTRFLNTYFLDNIIFWLIFTFLLYLTIKIALKKKNHTTFVFPILMTVSIISCLLSLYLCGKTMFGEYWIMHNNIIFSIFIMLLCPTFLFLDYIYEQINNKKVQLFIPILIIFTSVLLFIQTDFQKTRLSYSDKVKIYKAEKILRFNDLKGKILYVPLEDISIRLPDEKPYKTYIFFLSQYYQKVYYNISSNTPLDIIVSTEAEKQFYKDGGIFTDYELKNIKFSRLYNDNFVLNKQ